MQAKEKINKAQLSIDKLNGNIAFNEEKHVYWDITNYDREFISVTTIIHGYTEVFDEFFFSRYKSLEALSPDYFPLIKSTLLKTKKWDDRYVTECGVSMEDFNNKVKETLEAWVEKSRKACEHGTAEHLKRELRFYNGGKIKDLSPRFADRNYDYICKKNYFELDLEYGIYPEYLISWTSKDGLLNLSGQVDLILKEGNDISIIDFKTNEKGIEMKSYYNKMAKSHKMMLFPLNNLMDCTLYHYTMQLSLYAWMLKQKNPELNIKLLMLKHISREGVETDIEVEYKEQEVLKMLTHYKKQMYVNSERAKR